MSGTSRPLDSGRRDALGRPIKVAENTSDSRADAPPPPAGNGFEYKPPVRQMPTRLPETAGASHIGQILQDDDLFAEAGKQMIEPGDSLAYTVDQDGAVTGGMLWLSDLPGGSLTLEDQIIAEGAEHQDMRIITRTDDGYIISEWPTEPEGLEVTEIGSGSWTASDGSISSNQYASRDAAIAAWHRERRRTQRNNRIAANTDRWRHLANTLPEADPETAELIGDINIGYIGNLDQNRDDRQWSIAARKWCEPGSVYPTNPVPHELGRTDNIVRIHPANADAEFDQFVTKLKAGIEDGRYKPRRYFIN